MVKEEEDKKKEGEEDRNNERRSFLIGSASKVKSASRKRDTIEGKENVSCLCKCSVLHR